MVTEQKNIKSNRINTFSCHVTKILNSEARHSKQHQAITVNILYGVIDFFPPKHIIAQKLNTTILFKY
jgi:ribosomal protein L11 methylase PrmA